MVKKYRVILFDCFNTLFLPVASRMPTILLDGRQTPSTAGLLLEHLAESNPGLAPEAVHWAMRDAWRWAESLRGEECREISALERFGRMFEMLELTPPGDEQLTELLATHMEGVTRSYALPAGYQKLLRTLRRDFRLAIFSNFDYAPALLNMLRRQDIEPWFDPIVVSATIGYRKPGRRAFDKALEMVGEDRRRILFVGDSLADDVAGAGAAGLDVAWVNVNGETAPPELRPTFSITSLIDIANILT